MLSFSALGLSAHPPLSPTLQPPPSVYQKLLVKTLANVPLSAALPCTLPTSRCSSSSLFKCRCFFLQETWDHPRLAGQVPPWAVTDPRFLHPSQLWPLPGHSGCHYWVTFRLLGLMRTGSRMSRSQPCPALPSPGCLREYLLSERTHCDVTFSMCLASLIR